MNKSQKILLLCLAFSLATGKWGAWIGLSKFNFFLLDLIVVTTCIIYTIKNRALSGWLEPSLILVFIYCGIQLYSHQEFSYSVVLRDLLPFFYLLLIPIMIEIFRGIPTEKVIKSIRWACLGHAIWVDLLSVGLISPIDCGPLCGIPVFTPRSDHSAMVLAIGLLAFLDFPKLRIKGNSIGLIFLFISLLLNYSRAGLLAFIFALTVAIFRIFVDKPKLQREGAKFLFFLLIAAPLGAIVISYSQYLPENSSISRTLNTNISSELSGNSDGTIRARISAQKLLLDYTFYEKRQYFGSGAGSEVVLNSGAVRYLSGSSDVRAPHNWFVGLFAKFGLVGFLIWVGFQVFWLRKASTRLTIGANPYFSMILVIYIVSLFGVIIESPFGSLPLSVLIAIAVSRKIDVQTELN